MEVDDDPIVKEIDVYLNRLDQGDIYLLQYPLRPIYRPYGDQGQLTTLSYRRNQRTFRFAYNLNVDSQNFDSHIKMNIDEELKNGQIPPVATHVLQSSEVLGPACPPDPEYAAIFQEPKFQGFTKFALGIFKHGNLYITPVDHVHQMRPVFHRIDEEREKAEVRGRTHRTKTEETAAEEEEVPPAKDTPKKGNAPKEKGEKESSKTAAKQSQDADRAKEGKKRTRLSNSKLRDLQEAEAWIPVEAFYDMDSPEAHEVVGLLCSFPVSEVVHPSSSGPVEEAIDIFMNVETPEREEKAYIRTRRVVGGDKIISTRFDGSAMNYIDAMMMGTTSSSPEMAAACSGPLSFLSLNKLTLDEQVKIILMERQVEKFEVISNLVTKSADEQSLVNVLQRFGYVVQGNWICKSQFVFEAEMETGGSEYAMAYANYQAACRDLIICLMAHGTPVVREIIKKNPLFAHLTMKAMTDMLKQISIFENAAWKLKLPPDQDFIEKFPSAVETGKRRFLERSGVEEIKSSLEKAIKSLQLSNQKVSQGTSSKVAERVAMAVVSSSMAEGMERLKSCVASVLRREGGLTVAEATEKTAADMSAPLTAEDLLTVLPAVAEEIARGIWVLKRLGNEQLDPYRKLLIDLFRRDPMKRLTKPNIIDHFVTETKAHCSLADIQLRKLLREVAVNRQGYWVFKGAIKTEEEDAA